MRIDNYKNSQKTSYFPIIAVLQTIIEKHHQTDLVSDSPFMTQIMYGVLRFYPTLKYIADSMLEKPLTPENRDVFWLIIIGLYQLQHIHRPEYAIVQEVVDAAALDLNKPWTKKLVNALLRRFLRERKVLETQCASSEEAQYAHSQWLINYIKAAWPEEWQAILHANNQQAPMQLRVNRLKITRDDYLQCYCGEQQALVIQATADGIVLKNAVDVKKLFGFSEGLVSVQDAASQQVVDYLDLQPGLCVLDACAAPGGKTGHILEREPQLKQVVALDNAQKRLNKITENLNRLQLDQSIVTLACGDAADLKTWWDLPIDQPYFDRILVDAPCSALGVIRRHPDIKYLRSPESIHYAVQKQQQILEALWPLLKSGGRLVYTTCSVLPIENQEQVDYFVKTHSDAVLHTTKQVLPGLADQGTDGFFYAVLLKTVIETKI